jgi:adenylate cyclase
MERAKINTFAHGVETTRQFQMSPLNALYEGADEVRKSLTDPETSHPSEIFYRELRREGLTDYVVWPLNFTLGTRHVITFATSRPTGFAPHHIKILRDLVPVLTLVSEIRLKNVLARTLLETYVGMHASEQILAGATTRGSGATIRAAIMVCDLRDFTAISASWPRDDVINLLNGYFDAICGPIERNKGEILKFMGDGLLAIFPLENADACNALLRAIREGRQEMARFNEENVAEGRFPLRYGTGVHVGDVMYGNIGSRKRLDFTVIGPAVNIAARLEELTKTVQRSVLLSRDFVAHLGGESQLECLGPFDVQGLEVSIDVYALPDR